MANIVITLVIAFIFLAFAYMLRKSDKKDILQRETYNRTYATIDRMHNDGDFIRYYVSFDYNGVKVIAQTEDYKLKPNAIVLTGEIVEIGYCFLRNGTPYAVIFDDRLISVLECAPAFYKFMAIIGILLLFVAGGMFVARLLP